MSGTVQLSRKVGSSLLSTFNKENPKVKMRSAVKEPDNVDDLPVTTDDDDDDDDGMDEEDQLSTLQKPFVDSSDDDICSGDIQKTTFKRKINSNPPNAADPAKKKDPAELPGSTSRRRSVRRIDPKKRTNDEIEDDAEDERDLLGPKKAKTTSENIAGEVGAHMSFESLVLGKTTAQRGYGKKSQSSTPHAKLKTKSYTSDLTSPENKPKFKNKYAAINLSPAATLKVSYPVRTEERESSGFAEEQSSEGESDPPRALKGRNQKQKPIRRPGKKNSKKAIEFSPEPVSQRPQFKLPDAYNDYAPSAELVDLDVPIDDEPVKTQRPLDPGMALCPMCDEQVDEKLLQEFSNGERMKLVRQVRFCRMHKRLSAQKTWEEKGYPVVDWASLQARIDGHHDFLESIIMGSRSHFGDLLKDNIRTGQARTLLTTRDYLTPGYYGLRGMSVMTETVTDTFSKLLRKRAPVDTRISGRGYTGFVQSVLVPELAVKLIQEDLRVGVDKAREVMIESRAVGEILNDEKRQSQSKTLVHMHMESQEEEGGDGKDADSDGIASVELEIEQAADGVSDLSSPPFYSQRPTSANSRRAGDSDSDESLESLGGRKTKQHQASMKRQDVTTLPSEASPSNKDIKVQAPDEGDLSLASL
ncbi:hypothetical protein N0V93_003813 [Gnomoniopsis smithogilvyi]|uniref:Restriction of telomere capping protein 4 n=1 Tax=Gnomoniopsis smithogilvyi TaxID=1191159 RepID=A0A9W8YXC8_9PEZI|nr:hypothetical protein N0V93_003813 [Gnomoniopsis smithogilvyi]